MSKRILLFSLVAATLVNIVHLLRDRRRALLVPTKLKPGMMVFLKGKGSDKLRIGLLTADCRIALRVNFQPKQNITTMNTFDGQNWDTEEFFKRAPYKIGDPYLFYIQVTKWYFSLRLRGSPATGRLLANYTHHLPLKSITQVLLRFGRHNKPFEFAIVVKGHQMDILDDRPDEAEIRVIGKPVSDFTIDLLTNNSVALRLSFHDSYFGRNSRIAGHDWGCDETNGTFALEPCNKTLVYLKARKTGYEIRVNGKMFYFVYRVDPRLVTGVRVKGLEGHIVYSIRHREKAKYIPCIACHEWMMKAS